MPVIRFHLPHCNLYNMRVCRETNKNFILVIVVALSFLLIFTAFSTASQANESVLEGARVESGGSFTASGYTSLALLYFSFAVFSWISPCIVAFTNPKYGMLLGGLTYLIFLISFFKPVTWIIYVSSIVLGVGAAALWTAQGVFITHCSTRMEVNRNFAVFWMLFQISGIVGSVYTYLHLANVEFITSGVRIPMYGVLTGVCACGCLILLFVPLPNSAELSNFASAANPDENAALSADPEAHPWQEGSTLVSDNSNISCMEEPPENSSIRFIFFHSFALMKTPSMLAILTAAAFSGLNATLYSGVLGTCLSRMLVFGPSAKSYIGLSGIFIGIGEVIGSQMSLLSGYVRPGGIMFFGYAAAIISEILIFLMIPAVAPIEGTTQVAYIQPSVHLAMFIAFLLGIVDSVWNTLTSGLIGRTYPQGSRDTASAFALFKFVQSVASAISFFYSSLLLIHWQVLILSVTGSIGFFGYSFAERQYARGVNGFIPEA